LTTALRVDVVERLEDAVRAGRVVDRRHDGAAAGLLDRGAYRLGIGRHHNLADPGRNGAVEHMGDHRPARDVGERLAGQPAGGQPRRDQDHDVVAGHARKCLVKRCGSPLIRVARSDANRLFLRRLRGRASLRHPATILGAVRHGFR
jgi:hypothetical protein